VALLDQFGTTVKPGKLEILDIDDTFCAAASFPASTSGAPMSPPIPEQGRRPGLPEGRPDGMQER
jgi:hypothetical protein